MIFFIFDATFSPLGVSIIENQTAFEYETTPTTSSTMYATASATEGGGATALYNKWSDYGLGEPRATAGCNPL